MFEDNQLDTGFNDEFTLDMQKKFLSLLVIDKSWAQIDGLTIIIPEYFENKLLKLICDGIHKLYKKYNKIPGKLALEEYLKMYVDDNTISQQSYYKLQTYIDDIYKIDSNDDYEFYKEKAVSFVQQMEWKKALQSSKKFLKTNNYMEALDEFKKVLSISGDSDLGMDMSELDSIDFLDQLKESQDPKSMVQTGIKGWDEALGGGFVKDNIHLIAGAPGMGKAISIFTPILTPDGWKKAGDIKVNDYLISRKGLHTKVLAVYPQGKISNYKICFNDGFETNCCNNHLWTVIDRIDKTEKVLSLQEIINAGLFKKGVMRWKIPLVEPVQFSEKQFVIHPYNMGVILAKNLFKDSALFKFLDSNEDSFIQNKFKSFIPNIEDKHFINTYITELVHLNLNNIRLHKKFIPEKYKFGSVEQRTALLQGLFDVIGIISKNSRISCTVINERFAKDIAEIVQSLGGTAKIFYNINVSYKNTQYKYYKLYMTSGKINPFSLPKKAESWLPINRDRYITKIIKQDDIESVCFKVDNEESLFVIENYIVTHNSRTMAALAKHALTCGKRVIFITLELTELETITNIYSAATQMSSKELVNDTMRNIFVEKITTFKNQFATDLVVKFFRPDTVNANTLTNYIFKVKQVKEEKGFKNWSPDVIFLDYMDKLLPIQKVKGNIYEDNGGVASDCKNLAITFHCPVVTGSQLGRYTWSIEGDQVITMSSIAESARKAHLAHSMTTINENPAERDNHLARLYMAKSRTGTTGKIIYIEKDLARCTIKEVEPWDPKTLIATNTCTIKKDANGK